MPAGLAPAASGHPPGVWPAGRCAADVSPPWRFPLSALRSSSWHTSPDWRRVA